MRSFHIPQRPHTLLVAFLLAAVCALALAPTANAAVVGCRADPVVKLSDGTVLDVSVAIDADVSDVSEIHYTVHGPLGADSCDGRGMRKRGNTNGRSSSRMELLNTHHLGGRP